MSWTSMCGAELSRLRHRRSLRNMALACFVVLVLGVIGVSFQYHSMGASDAFQVKTKAASVEAAETAAYQECVASKPVIPLYVACGLPIRDRDYEFTQYMTDKPFTLELAMPQYARILGLFFALMAFVIGAVWIGVEWQCLQADCTRPNTNDQGHELRRHHGSPVRSR